MLHNQKEAARRQTTKPQVGHGTMIDRIRAALEKETRINLHRFPIKLEFAGEDLVLTGELEDVAAKKLALELAAPVAPGVGLVDRLRVNARPNHERR